MPNFNFFINNRFVDACALHGHIVSEKDEVRLDTEEVVKTKCVRCGVPLIIYVDWDDEDSLIIQEA